MGLDLYAGTFTRYYTRNWKTVVEAWAEANGVDFKRTEAEDEEKLSPEEVQAIVCAWRDEMLQAVTPENQLPETWEESNDKAYYTDKPDWDAFGAMLLVTAAHTYEETIPETLEKGWDFTEHPLIKRLAEDHEHVYSLFRSVMVWVPITKSTMVFRGPMPTGNEVMIGTLGALEQELEHINEICLARQGGDDPLVDRNRGLSRQDAQGRRDGRRGWQEGDLQHRVPRQVRLLDLLARHEVRQGKPYAGPLRLLSRPSTQNKSRFRILIRDRLFLFIRDRPDGGDGAFEHGVFSRLQEMVRLRKRSCVVNQQQAQ